MTTATATRRLAAILVADVVGYSRLMGADEEGTHERCQAHLSELVDPKIREHHGRIVKTTGDGVLAEFASVVDAVRCGAEIQRAMADRDLDLVEDRRLRFRIGVNLGDVIADGDDIYGDGVNIAARLEGLAAPGSICVSGTVRDHIGDRLPYVFEDMGEQSVKNIARPVRVYALRPEGIAGLPTAIVSSSTSSSLPLPTPRLSIVVLPFTNLGDDREQQYFADGITEDLTSDLSRLANMFVISRNTAFTYRNKPIDTKQILITHYPQPSRSGTKQEHTAVSAGLNDGAQQGAISKGAQRGPVCCSLRNRGSVPGSGDALALAIRLCLPGLRRAASQLGQDPGALPVCRLSTADIRDRRNDFRGNQGAAVHLVSRHVPPHSEQGRHLQH